MSEVTLTIKPVETQHPAGTVGGDWLFHIVGGEKPYDVDTKVAQKSTVYKTELAPGLYVAKACRLDMNGNQIGSEARVEFEVLDEGEAVVIETAGGLGVLVQ